MTQLTVSDGYLKHLCDAVTVLTQSVMRNQGCGELLTPVGTDTSDVHKHNKIDQY